MQARFLLGPAGSGKTFRCLAEIRAALQAEPDGPPLVLLAPKQATFQLERQLLATGEIAGFTRLHIFSFDKLARHVFEQLNQAPPKTLSGEGRVMVLRALLLRHEADLKLFGRSARRPGFAAELAKLLSELQQQQVTSAKLQRLGSSGKLPDELRKKLTDLALLNALYTSWLEKHGLNDADCLLDSATEALRRSGVPAAFRIQHLWMDGFAEMTPQELDFLASILGFCSQATLAFCLDGDPEKSLPALSVWSAISKTFQQCRARVGQLPDVNLNVETLSRQARANRFSGRAGLRHLEKAWVNGADKVALRADAAGDAVRVVSCADSEAEAVLAAREILKFVRAGAGENRFRDCAVLTRTIDSHHKVLARVFRRYEIPFFLDRRESAAHHPLAELTRNALRTVAFDWRHDDWFAALKCGFSPASEIEIDRLENTALEFGWRGEKWRESMEPEEFARIVEKILPPFQRLFEQLAKLNFKPDGAMLARFIRGLWNGLNVEAKLEEWGIGGEELAANDRQSAMHATVWEQMNNWVDDLALAFPGDALPLADWLPVLDAGLAGLTVGVVPPALDQVLIGAVDRARNPDLKLALLLGVNESIFPATPGSPVILTRADRDELDLQKVPLGPGLFDQISRERYLGYIACTRASERLVLSFSQRNHDGKTLNPSPFVAQLQKIFPALNIEECAGDEASPNACHVSDLVPLILASRAGDDGERDKPHVGFPSDFTTAEPGRSLWEQPALKSLSDRLAALHEPDGKEALSRMMAGALYGPVLRSSVSRLEEFAQCPFKFFMRVGLRAGERKVFELDARERGNFQHNVLKTFHEQLQSGRRRWRDLTPAEARERIKSIGAAQLESFRNGLFRDSAESLFAARSMVLALQDFIEVIVTWMRGQYEFDPVRVELGFGGNNDLAPAWKIDLGQGLTLALQGRIDRVDLWRKPGDAAALAVVIDYKSGGKKLDSLLVENGVQLQLLAYLGALRHWPDAATAFGVKSIVPAGAFYVSLLGKYEAADSRDEMLDDANAKCLAYRHNGRFDATHLRLLDRRTDVAKGDQFNFRLNKDGGLPSNSTEALPREKFMALLDDVEVRLKELGTNIFSGAAAVDPYRQGKTTPCDFCDYRAVCRIDVWTHEWRGLCAASKETKS